MVGQLDTHNCTGLSAEIDPSKEYREQHALQASVEFLASGRKQGYHPCPAPDGVEALLGGTKTKEAAGGKTGSRSRPYVAAMMLEWTRE